ncbi:unnamed protein product [Brassica napus]|uniref:(rape) hypothetical protein n=1 Tax=Brassica napus TaxID=3708 RepID=A0A816W780_BRANA|nr:unnamed protein product [Brassica napus]
MAAMNNISELKPFKSMWKVKVKIIRLWKQYSAAGGETIEMVFVDSRGDKIHGTVKKDEVGQFAHVLHQGQTKLLINFTVTHSSGSYRTTKHPYKVVFLPTTRVRICEALPYNMTGLEPVNYRAVLNGKLDPDFLVDVVGQVVEVSHIEVVSVNGKDTQKISVELRDTEDERLPLVLWGKFAEDISDAVQLRSENTVICVLRFGKIKIWKGNFVMFYERSVSNAYNVSDVTVNPENIAEVQAFIRLLPKDDLKLSIVDSKPLALANAVSEKDDFFVHTPRKTIAEVLESRQVEKCIVMATIAGIDSDMGWYYLSCKVCAKKVITVPSDNYDDGDEHDVLACNYYCPKCKTNSPKLLPRYKLHLVVLDNTKDCKFLLFDNLALQLLRQPCIELTGPITDEIQDPDVLPPILNDLKGKTFLFKIQIEKENFVYKHDTFKVLKIITNLGMINEFEAAQSPTGSENMLSGTFSTQSDAPEGSLMIQGGSSGSTDLTPAKRTRTPIINLEEAFDQNSVTKMACTIKRYSDSAVTVQNLSIEPESKVDMNRTSKKKKNENGDGIPPPKRRKQVNRTNEEPDLNVLQDITNSNGNITKDARMQRRLRLIQKRKFGDRNIQEVNQTGISMIQSQNVHKLPSQGSRNETQNQNISVMENHPIETQSNQTADLMASTVEQSGYPSKKRACREKSSSLIRKQESVKGNTKFSNRHGGHTIRMSPRFRT